MFSLYELIRACTTLVGLAIMLPALKITGAITWPWWMVLAPVWGLLFFLASLAAIIIWATLPWQWRVKR